jgi:hypothetical protein
MCILELICETANAQGIDKAALVKEVKQALYASKICSYAQGLNIIKAKSIEKKWGIDMGGLSRIWKVRSWSPWTCAGINLLGALLRMGCKRTGLRAPTYRAGIFHFFRSIDWCGVGSEIHLSSSVLWRLSWLAESCDGVCQIAPVSIC